MNLYNVLITDDEAFIVDCLTSLLEEQTDLNISIYRAYTPTKALELIERTRIDLLISDIQMPTYSGFDLSERLHQLWPNSKTILLTAYSDFTYAQKAIKQGIISYVLKTSDDREILAEIKKALQTIDKECNHLTLINNIEKDLKNFQTRLNTQIFFLWLKGYYAPQNLTENINTLGFNLQKSTRFLLLICRINSLEQADTRQLQKIMKPFQIQRIVEHYLTPHLVHSFYEVQDDLLLGILQLHAEVKTGVSQIIGSALELAQTSCLETLKCRISCLISPEGTAENIPSFWSWGKSLLPQFSEEMDFVFSYESYKDQLSPDANSEENYMEQLFKSSFYKTMKRHLENGDRGSFTEMLSQVCTYLSQNSNWHNNYSLQVYFSLVLVFIGYINQNKLGTQIAFHAGTGMLFRPWLADSWHSIETNLYQMADILFLLKEESAPCTGNTIVQNVQNYIDSHVTEDISLLDLANATGYSTSYLSKYYSDTTGTTISGYMSSKKLEAITHLMLETDMNIGEISAFMGFHSRTYFNNYIKRLTGMSPQQYRESLSSAPKER